MSGQFSNIPRRRACDYPALNIFSYPIEWVGLKEDQNAQKGKRKSQELLPARETPAGLFLFAKAAQNPIHKAESGNGHVLVEFFLLLDLNLLQG